MEGFIWWWQRSRLCWWRLMFCDNRGADEDAEDDDEFLQSCSVFLPAANSVNGKMYLTTVLSLIGPSIFNLRNLFHSWKAEYVRELGVLRVTDETHSVQFLGRFWLWARSVTPQALPLFQSALVKQSREGEGVWAPDTLGFNSLQFLLCSTERSSTVTFVTSRPEVGGYSPLNGRDGYLCDRRLGFNRVWQRRR